jgi:tagatose 1,6-diphosphate aldolase
MRFVFLDPGPLTDGDLSLVAPEPRWADEVLRSCAHPMTVREAPEEASLTPLKLNEFLKAAPRGQQEGDVAAGRLPAYHFWMLLDPPVGDPPLRIAGGMGFRVGTSAEIERYSGNIGYHVYPPARGRHLSERACRLVFPLARRHGMERLWITCNPDNAASRRTCERLGARLVEVVTLPRDHPFRARGETQKCRFLIELAPSR